jgi:hypothetical protein
VDQRFGVAVAWRVAMLQLTGSCAAPRAYVAEYPRGSDGRFTPVDYEGRGRGGLRSLQ